MASFGAMPPEDGEWQVGKTAAAIRFVNDASTYLEGTVPGPDTETLTKWVEVAKSGAWVPESWIDIVEFVSVMKYMDLP